MTVSTIQFNSILDKALEELLTGTNSSSVAVYPNLKTLERYVADISKVLVLGQPIFKPYFLERGKPFPVDKHNKNISNIIDDITNIDIEQKNQTLRVLTSAEIGEIDRRRISNKIKEVTKVIDAIALVTGTNNADYAYREDFSTLENIDANITSAGIQDGVVSLPIEKELYSNEIIFKSLSPLKSSDGRTANDTKINSISGNPNDLLSPYSSGMQFKVTSQSDKGAEVELVVCFINMKSPLNTEINKIIMEYSSDITANIQYTSKEIQTGDWEDIDSNNKFEWPGRTTWTIDAAKLNPKGVKFKLKSSTYVNALSNVQPKKYEYMFNLKNIKVLRREYSSKGTIYSSTIKIDPHGDETVSLDAAAILTTQRVSSDTNIDYYIAPVPYIEGQYWGGYASGIVPSATSSGSINQYEYIAAGNASWNTLSWSRIVPINEYGQRKLGNRYASLGGTKSVTASGLAYSTDSTHLITIPTLATGGSTEYLYPILNLSDDDIPLINSSTILAGKQCWRLELTKDTIVSTDNSSIAWESYIEVIYDSTTNTYKGTHTIYNGIVPPFESAEKYYHMQTGPNNSIGLQSVTTGKEAGGAPISGAIASYRRAGDYSYADITIPRDGNSLSANSSDSKTYVTIQQWIYKEVYKEWWVTNIYIKDQQDYVNIRSHIETIPIYLTYFGNQGCMLDQLTIKNETIIWDREGWTEVRVLRIGITQYPTNLSTKGVDHTSYGVFVDDSDIPLLTGPISMYAFRFPMKEVSLDDMLWNVFPEDHKKYAIKNIDGESTKIYVNDMCRQEYIPLESGAVINNFVLVRPSSAIYSTVTKTYLAMSPTDPNTLLTNVNGFFTFDWVTDSEKIDTFMIRADLSSNTNDKTISPEIDSISVLLKTTSIGDANE